MKQRNIDLDKIMVPEVRITAQYDQELHDQLGVSLAQAGQLQPIIVMEDDQGFILVDGLHRIKEAERRGDKTIPAIIHRGTEVDALISNIACSRLKGEISIYDLIKTVGHLTNVLGLDSDEIRKKTGMSREYIERLWKVAEACPELLDAIQRKAVGLGVAYEIARLPGQDQQRYVLDIAEHYKKTVREVKETVDEVLALMQSPQAKPEPVVFTPPPPPTCDICQAETRPRDLRPFLLCPECFGDARSRQRRANAASVIVNPPATGQPSP